MAGLLVGTTLLPSRRANKPASQGLRGPFGVVNARERTGHPTLTQTDYPSIALMNVILAVLFFIFLIYMVDLEAVRTRLRQAPS